MLPTHLLPRRIPRLIRPLRPPSGRIIHPKARLFTNNSQLLLISAPGNRPQLPFLYSPVTPYSHRGLNPRLLSTESRRHITNGLKIAATAYAVMVLLYVIKLGLQQEDIERQFPTPPELSAYSRWIFRCAWALQNPETIGMALSPWRRVAEFYTELLERMENPEIDGKGLKEQGGDGEGEELMIAGVGKAGYDIEQMSEPWKMGYFQALMGAAEAAEKLDGWLYDEAQDVAVPAEYVVGPSNPNPKPQPMGMKGVLKEENCRSAAESPEVYYMKILTTKGFQTNQRLDAALAYADWLGFKGLKDTADDMYRWAMDIAVSGLPVESSKVLDTRTGVLKDDANEYVTDNVLRVTTALGVHKVRQGDLASALSIFLSVLRARRELPPGHVSKSASEASRKPPKDENPISEMFDSIKSFFFPRPYPVPTLTGNERAVRTAASACEEAGLMAYVGEIIFASSSQETGLAWTRDAVDLAELSLLQLDENHERSRSHGMRYASPEERCYDCLRTGINNWKKMVRTLVVKAEQEEVDSLTTAKDSWFTSREKKLKEKEMQRRRWEAEEMIVDDRSKRVQRFIGDPLLSGLAPNTTMMLFS